MSEARTESETAENFYFGAGDDLRAETRMRLVLERFPALGPSGLLPPSMEPLLSAAGAERRRDCMLSLPLLHQFQAARSHLGALWSASARFGTRGNTHSARLALELGGRCRLWGCVSAEPALDGDGSPETDPGTGRAVLSRSYGYRRVRFSQGAVIAAAACLGVPFFWVADGALVGVAAGGRA